MFTGLITERGEVTAIQHGDSSAIVTLKAPGSVMSLNIGDSIAVNGVCLTATSLTEDSFTADIMIQTLQLTSLSQLKPGLICEFGTCRNDGYANGRTYCSGTC